MTDAFVTILVGIGSLFYQLMQLLADLFMNVSLIQILNNDTVAIIYQRVGLILGIFMLFKITFSFIQMIIDPDIVTDKEKGFGNIIKKLVIVVVLLGLTPSIFSGALELQNKLLGRNSDGTYKGENVISRIVLGKGNELGSFGTSFSATLFSSFFDSNARISREEFLEDVDFQSMNDRTIDYNSIGRDGFGENIGSSFFMLAVGAFGCWVFLMYTLSTGLRAVQLMFLQLISPIPIISYVSSKKETAFHAWVKQCITTYIDLFIRLFILYIGILAISLLMSSNLQDQIALSIGDTYGPTGQGIITIVLIIGVLLFIKKAPDLIGELFPGLKNKASGDFGFGLKSRTDIPDPARRLIGAGLGAPIGAVGNGLGRLAARGFQNKNQGKPITSGMAKAFGTGMLSGFGRGALGGLTAKNGVLGGISKDARAKMSNANARSIKNQDNEYTFGERAMDYAAGKLGFADYVQNLKRDKVGHEARKNVLKSQKDLFDWSKSESKSKLESAEYEKSDFEKNPEGLRIREVGRKATRLKRAVADLSDPNSETRKRAMAAYADPKVGTYLDEERFYSEFAAASARINSDNSLSDAEKSAKIEKAEAELMESCVFHSFEEQYNKTVRYSDEANKTWDKEYLTYAANESISGSAANQNLIRKIKENETIRQQSNEQYTGVETAQVEHSLLDSNGKFDFSDFDDFVKSKGDYGIETKPDGSSGAKTKGLGLAEMETQSATEIDKIDRAIATRENKIDGNKSGGK